MATAESSAFFQWRPGVLTRSTRSMVTFSNDFMIGDSQRELAAGTYEIVVEEELMQGLSFEAYRRIATYLMVQGRGSKAGQTTMQVITQEDLEHAIACDQALPETTNDSEAALSPQEDKT
ncbi:hypothetical protein [uncultured Tateyamaria sp.]|uniref:hypothetical protein n=2 Tax=Rhodobacterales TaxID=204455 RepID=UPI0026381B09|nr:hypothetical protein [uncultured Tateyamaria sp.]